MLPGVSEDAGISVRMVNEGKVVQTGKKNTAQNGLDRPMTGIAT